MDTPATGSPGPARRPALRPALRNAVTAALLAAVSALADTAPGKGDMRQGSPGLRAGQEPAAASAAAGATEPPAVRPGSAAAGTADPMADKFRKLQREMAGDRAAGAERPAPAAPPEPVGLLPASLKILFGLAFVILLAVVSIRALKRLQGRLLARPGQASGGALLEVLETCHLGPQQRVVALRIDGEVGIVGVTQHGISLLATLPQPADDVRKRMAGAGNPAAFSESLNKLLERFKKPKRVSDLLEEQA